MIHPVPVVITQQAAAERGTFEAQAHDEIRDEARTARKGEPSMTTTHQNEALAQQGVDPPSEPVQSPLSEIVIRGLETMNRITASETNSAGKPEEGGEPGEGGAPGPVGPDRATICILLYAVW
ncbi:hypothetical protein GCM10010446_44750 [Streptomyces enissocaesilis]|uniref:Uncharacterized protein n=1 Tax=Streptomyces enissocaesilis TaxID=332589 RepID=A0ABN3XG87_9ACTN